MLCVLILRLCLLQVVLAPCSEGSFLDRVLGDSTTRMEILWTNLPKSLLILWPCRCWGRSLTRYSENAAFDHTSGPISHHALRLTVYNRTFALWFGWYGFNPGSILFVSTASNGAVAALAAVNTTLAACAGAVSALFTSTVVDYYYTGVHTYDVTYTMNGCLTGLVAITAGCAVSRKWQNEGSACSLMVRLTRWQFLPSDCRNLGCRVDWHLCRMVLSDRLQDAHSFPN
jgi:Ammonium Transporter Family